MRPIRLVPVCLFVIVSAWLALTVVQAPVVFADTTQNVTGNIKPPPPPVIYQPINGIINPDGSVSLLITGQDFTGPGWTVKSIALDGVLASDLTVYSSNQITASWNSLTRLNSYQASIAYSDGYTFMQTVTVTFMDARVPTSVPSPIPPGSTQPNLPAQGASGSSLPSASPGPPTSGSATSNSVMSRPIISNPITNNSTVDARAILLAAVLLLTAIGSGLAVVLHRRKRLHIGQQLQ